MSITPSRPVRNDVACIDDMEGLKYIAEYIAFAAAVAATLSFIAYTTAIVKTSETGYQPQPL